MINKDRTNIRKMGIPFYFKKLFTMFGKQLLCKVNIGATCDVLYLDFNCLIHQSAQAVVSAQPTLSQHEYEPLVIDHVLTNLISLTNVVRPTKMLYIGIDGLCPRAKMTQQRKRRYMTVWRKEQEIVQMQMQMQNNGTLVSQPDWDSNIITPGTRFMKALDDMLAAFINTNQAMFKFEIILSPSSAPGEGEHKIFQVMKERQDLRLDQEDAVIYGLDADLILLSMISPNSDNIRLLRERPEFGHTVPQHSKMASAEYIFLNVKSLAGCMTSYFLGSSDSDKDKDSSKAFIYDYVMLSSLLGNDFLPPLSFLNIRDGGIERIMDAYKKIKADFGGEAQANQNLVHDHGIGIGAGADNGKLNTMMLTEIIKELARKEDIYMGEACDKYYAPPRVHHANANANAFSIDSYPQHVKHMPIIDPKVQGHKWRDTYYATLFLNKMSIQTICEDYVDALEWVHAYYFTHNASMTWYYQHAYSPLASDLGNMMSTKSSRANATATDKTMHDALLTNSSLQLLAVLPPCSSGLFDDTSSKCKAVMHNLAHGCVHMYPSHFRIHTFLKTYLWECSPVLPAIDIERLHIASAFSNANAIVG